MRKLQIIIITIFITFTSCGTIGYVEKSEDNKVTINNGGDSKCLNYKHNLKKGDKVKYIVNWIIKTY